MNGAVLALGRRRALVALALVPLLGCSEDAVEQPEPRLEQAGTFVAVEDGPDHFRLFRVRDSLRFDPERTYLFLDEYRPGARTLAEAKRFAQNSDLVFLRADIVLLQDFARTRYTIVWHRTLRDDERG